MASSIAPPPTAQAAPAAIPPAQQPASGFNTVGQIAGANNNTSATSAAQQQQSTGNTSNTYNQGQTDLQGSLPSFYNNLLSGNIPSSFTTPQAPVTAYEQNFQSMQAPSLALNGGSGSPMIAGQEAQGLAQLQSNLYQQGASNYMNALGGATNNAFTATGANNSQDGSGAQTGTGAANQSYDQNDNSNYTALQSIMSILSGTPGAVAGLGSIFGF